ncbi:hypothetical protein BDA99DRAFT_609704 [Phascolomyces articulosus]|uniref:Transcriptional regulatory protein RXT2 N-terminal domain-containing protein n=1 Tax=Phascolomyces articulosus TaxID=60185 RepID=A0AAD5JN66_9FUNG|nr:hypothetical protein BDA99DRAFT_609704 [Phascolomyces articulosus]
MNDPFAHAAPSSSSNTVPHSTERSQSNNNITPASSKWIRDDNVEKESDQVGLVAHNRGYKLNNWASTDSQLGGNKLRAPRTLANEEEFLLGDKKRTVVKRRRRELDEELSDTEEDDPYRKINIEDILSPIEYPTDIVRRPALKRIIKSPQIEELSNTAMEFIEGEKNFCKILSRLSAILHHDDPQYLDLNFERTPEQRKAVNGKTTNKESATAATTNTNSTTTDAEEVADKNNDKQKDQQNSTSDENTATQEKSEDNADASTTKPKEDEQKHDEDMTEASEDTEAQEVVRNVRELLLENINFSNEYLWRLQGARSKLVKANMQKENLWQQLKASAKEEEENHDNPSEDDQSLDNDP